MTLSEIDRRDTWLWIVFSRWLGAMEAADDTMMTKCLGEFVRMLRAYEAACDATLVQGVLA